MLGIGRSTIQLRKNTGQCQGNSGEVNHDEVINANNELTASSGPGERNRRVELLLLPEINSVKLAGSWRFSGPPALGFTLDHLVNSNGPKGRGIVAAAVSNSQMGLAIAEMLDEHELCTEFVTLARETDTGPDAT